jgi:altronate dehydratase large subunit
VTFEGYIRANGSVGVRNHVLVFPTVICAAAVAQRISESVPGTVYVGHPHGCGHLGADKEHMVRSMTGYCTNPNVGAVLLIGLGCEELTPALLAPGLQQAGQRFEAMSIQAEGGTTPAITRGCELARRLVEDTAGDRRQVVDISRLTVGVKCGGSDTLSGLTANPATGEMSDLLVAAGGTIIMTEVPEMIGAEHVLAERAADSEARDRIFHMVADMEAAILAMGVDVRGSEPSPGNIAGGLTTLEEKSLGAVLKGGRSPIQEVVAYGQRPTRKGLVVMDGPAQDAVCITGMLAAGAQIIVFTTGRGSPMGAAIAPVLKVATNSAMYRAMTDNMDLDAGEVLDGSITLPEMGRRIFEEILSVASGGLTRSEVLRHHEFAIHSIGPAV